MNIYTSETEYLKTEVQRLSALVRAQQITIDKLDQALAAPVQEPVAYLCENAVGHKYFRWKKPSGTYKPIALYTTPPAQPAPVQERNFCERCGKRAGDYIHTCTPPAAQPAPVQPIIGSYLEKNNSQFKFSDYEPDGVHHNKPAVPDAFGTREGEHPQYIQGWNDCRAETLKMRKP